MKKNVHFVVDGADEFKMEIKKKEKLSFGCQESGRRLDARFK